MLSSRNSCTVRLSVAQSDGAGISDGRVGATSAGTGSYVPDVTAPKRCVAPAAEVGRAGLEPATLGFESPAVAARVQWSSGGPAGTTRHVQKYAASGRERAGA